MFTQLTKEEQNELRSVFFDQSDTQFVLYDSELNIVDVNEFSLKLYHLQKQELIGKNIEEVSPGVKESGRFQLYLDVIRTGKMAFIDDVFPHPSLGYVCNRIKAFKVGNGMGMVATNISDLRDTIEELDSFMYKSANDLLRNVSHLDDLVSTALVNTHDFESAIKSLELIKEQTERLDFVLHKLGESTKIKHLEKTSQPIDFNEIVGTIFKKFSHQEEFRQIRIEKEIRTTSDFYSDKSLIASLLQNLIENAVKYRAAVDKEPFIQIRITEEKQEVKIVIADNGIGIPEYQQKKVFQMFYRATDQASGSGLGLYIVKNCVKKLRGHIKMDSKENEGTTFTLYLPNTNRGRTV